MPLSTTATQGVVNFGWEEAQNTDSYEIFVRNSITQTEQKKSADLTSTTFTLDRGVPYSWWVVSSSEASAANTRSEVWAFYLEALQQQSFLPFSALLNSPQDEQEITLSSGAVNLQWTGSDLDDDIAYYQVYIGTDAAQMSLVQDNQITSSYSALLDVGQTYFWQIITVDQRGNKSQSAIKSFITS
ncbi:MAG: hypothetical protein DA394_01330 [Candidatus Arcticimaribacter sp.]|nr:MAG: hypothetical protein DA394_01330 [Candidatus Arcticimaribacter sp.]